MVWFIAPWLMLVAVVDHRTSRIPNALLAPLAVIAVVAIVDRPVAVIGALAAGLPYLVGFVRGHCGGGDAKLAACCGAVLGSPVAALAVVLVAALVSAAECLLTGHDRRPHGPALAGASAAALLLMSL